MSEVAIHHFIAQMKVLSLLDSGTSNKVIEDMEVPFSRRSSSHATLFKVVIQSFGSM